MTTTDPFSGYNPPPPPPPAAPRPTPGGSGSAGGRVLRRSRTDRVGAGVAGGLGAYFDVDPVIFRVLFATSAFFGGAGVLAYLLAWGAIPEEGTQHAAVDGWVRALRARRVPFWLVLVVAGLLFWAIAFSWWVPRPFFPLMGVVVIAVVFLAFRTRRHGGTGWVSPDAGTRGASTTAAPTSAPDPASVPVDLTKRTADSDTAAFPNPPAPGAPPAPAWLDEARAWMAESREQRRIRRARAMPVRIAVVATLILTLAVLALVDATTGIWFAVYFWAVLGIVLVGLLAGLVLRRPHWSTAPLLIPAIIGLIAFGGSRASLHDGIGDTTWTPVSSPASSYRLGIGQGTLDLRSLQPQDGPRTIDVTLAAGQIRIVAPRSMKLTVESHVHIGNVEVEHHGIDHAHGGVGLSRTVRFDDGTSSGQPVTVDVHIATGNVDIVRN